MDYDTRAKSRCEGLPGFLQWGKVGGGGYNLSIFNPPEPSGGAQEPTPQEPAPPAAPSGPNACQYANDGVCDEPNVCDSGTDTDDCRRAGDASAGAADEDRSRRDRHVAVQGPQQDEREDLPGLQRPV